jgi:hypothetical protein
MPRLLRIDIGGLTTTQQTVIAPSYPDRISLSNAILEKNVYSSNSERGK